MRKAAYQCLGPFISTFCTPPNSVNDESTSDSIDPLSETELFDTSLIGSSSSEETIGNTSSGNTTSCSMPSPGSVTSCSTPSGSDSSPEVTTIDRTPSKGAPYNTGSHVISPLIIFQTPPHPVTTPLTTPTPENTEYNSFQFWRSPISTLCFDDTQNRDTQKEGGVNLQKEDVVNCNTNDKLKLDLFGGVVLEDELTSSVEGEEEETERGDGLADIKDELLAESEVGGVSNNEVFTSEGEEERFVDVSKLKIMESPLGVNGFPKVGVVNSTHF